MLTAIDAQAVANASVVINDVYPGRVGREIARYGIRVNTLVPSVFETSMTEAAH